MSLVRYFVSGMHSTPCESAPDNLGIGGRVDPRAGLDYAQKIKLLTLPGLELRPLCRPARIQSL
jgi:hypothetical protein